MDKMRGEAMIISGKLGKNEKKVEEGKSLMGKWGEFDAEKVSYACISFCIFLYMYRRYPVGFKLLTLLL